MPKSEFESEVDVTKPESLSIFKARGWESVGHSSSEGRVVKEHRLVERVVKRDNVNVHRAAANIIVSKSRAARGSVCNDRFETAFED